MIQPLRDALSQLQLAYAREAQQAPPEQPEQAPEQPQSRPGGSGRRGRPPAAPADETTLRKQAKPRLRRSPCRWCPRYTAAGVFPAE